MIIYNREFDERSECHLILSTMKLSEYKDLVQDAFLNKGNLEGQRNVISQSSVATKIRSRMAEDFRNGAIFPQVVIGLLVSEENFLKFHELDTYGMDKDFAIFVNLIKNTDKKSLSIIDGMQRTNVYFENSNGNEDRPIRVEFYVTTSMTKLLYRMLVLNTGQVPWNTRRQLEVIFSHLSKSVQDRVNKKNHEIAQKITINAIDDNKRRRQSGVFNKSTLIEMYLSFNTRNVKVNLSNEIAEEFQRFDMLESIEKEENFDLFIDTFILLCKLDFALGENIINDNTSNENNEIIDFDIIDTKNGKKTLKQGKDFFTNAPIIMGFITACAEYILGAVTVNRTIEAKQKKLKIVTEHVDYIISKIQTDNKDDFIDLDTLNLALSSLSKKGNIGENQRKFFKDAFIEIFKYEDLDEINSLAAFWRE